MQYHYEYNQSIQILALQFRQFHITAMAAAAVIVVVGCYCWLRQIFAMQLKHFRIVALQQLAATLMRRADDIENTIN